MQAGESVRLWLTGDVMLGRGIDQVLPSSVDPTLHEPWVKDARRYVELAEEENGPIPAPVEHDYPWGEALSELERLGTAAGIMNLETAITDGGEPWPGKGIHYRMHPDNVGAVAAPDTDVCVLANNHAMDWGRAGLEDTLRTLEDAGIAVAGAGRDLATAAAPVVHPLPEGRLLVFALGATSAGIPADWAATEARSGLWLLEGESARAAGPVAERIAAVRRPGDVVVVSVHWGGNWGYDIPEGQRRLAQALIREAGVDLVHGHSSHHPKGIEVHDGRAILYGCGDLINDYEGIGGHREFRPELSLLYCPRLDPEGRLVELEMVPMRIRRFRLERAGVEEGRWLAERLTGVGPAPDTRIEAGASGRLYLRRVD